MPCPHNEITIVQRSQRQSAVAAAAYQSGEKLFCEYDQQVKHYPEKRGIVHNEILLPANAPPEYADRNTLWNAAEAVEKQWNSQLARRWVLSIPREIPPDQYAALVRDFCNQQFVSKGMCVDFAIHDKGDGNPHAHVMLTMRAMDEHGKWLPKSRKVYDLDENGERIKLPSGRWKSHKEDTVDWNDQKYCEIWRHEWEVIQNRYLEANDRPERVDLRSYARQGLDIIPTVHEGAAVRQMEKRGIQTNIGNLNREIRAANRLMKSIRQLIQNLKGWITELGEKRKELLAQKAAEEATLLPNLLMKYMEIRKEERRDWTRAGQNRGTSQDLKAVSEALSYLRQKGLSTVEDLEAFLESSGKSAADYRNQMKPKEARSKVIDGILASRTDCKECKPVYEKYQKIFFKKTKEKFKQEHPEVARYAKAAAYLAKHPDDKDSTQKELQEEQETLLEEIAEMKPEAIILSPGPGRPEDAGICIPVIKEFAGKIPILGVCLGHQSICEAFGGTVSYAKELMHGKKKLMYKTGESQLFKGLPDTFAAARYHSLAALKDTLPAELKVTAESEDGEVMAVEHTKYPVFGVQFHPESVMTPDGRVMIENFMEVVRND